MCSCVLGAQLQGSSCALVFMVSKTILKSQQSYCFIIVEITQMYGHLRVCVSAIYLYAHYCTYTCMHAHT